MFVLLSPQIKHSFRIPYEMYLLRFGRGGRQVLGYINSGGPALAQTERRDEVSPVTGTKKKATAFTIKALKGLDCRNMWKSVTN